MNKQLLFQPGITDFLEAFTWANNNLGQIYRIEFPSGYIEFKIDAQVVVQPGPTLPLPLGPIVPINPPVPIG